MSGIRQESLKIVQKIICRAKGMIFYGSQKDIEVWKKYIQSMVAVLLDCIRKTMCTIVFAK